MDHIVKLSFSTYLTALGLDSGHGLLASNYSGY
jgi:hypothetical protein